MSDSLLSELKSAIYLFNAGSDNEEYLRGQLELALHLLGCDYDDVDVVNELREVLYV